jgi:hypothetical protein
MKEGLRKLMGMVAVGALALLWMGAQPLSDSPVLQRSGGTNGTLAGQLFADSAKITNTITHTGNYAQTGAKTFSTGTGAVSLNGDTTVASGKILTVAGKLRFAARSTGVNGNITATDQVVLATASSITLTLAASSGWTLGDWVKVIVPSGVTGVTIARTGSDTINGGTSESLTGPQSVTYFPDGSSTFYH